VECLGVAGAAGDIEVMHLAARSMLAAGLSKPVLQVGHIGLLKALVLESSSPLADWTTILARRSPDDLAVLMHADMLSSAARCALIQLASGEGDMQWVADHIGKINAAFDSAAEELLSLVGEVGDKMEGSVSVYVDAAIMPRFLYHSGILFAGFAEGVPHAILHGGRYDAMMKAHGRDMPATGFSCDLWSLLDTL